MEFSGRTLKEEKKEKKMLSPPSSDWTWHKIKSSPALWVATQSQHMKQMLLLKFLQKSSENQVVLIT